MAENLTIVCDRCRERVSKRDRSRIRWSVQPVRREATDLCPECRDWLLQKLGKLPLDLLAQGGDGAR